MSFPRELYFDQRFCKRVFSVCRGTMRALFFGSALMLLLGVELVAASVQNDVLFTNSESLETIASRVNSRTIKSIKFALAGRSGESGFAIGRHMLQSSGTCTWEKEGKECAISFDKTESLLKKSKSPVAEAALEIETCVVQKDKKTCVKTGCLWREEQNECLPDLIAMVFGSSFEDIQNDPQSALENPTLLEVLELFVTCGAKSKSKCKGNCAWDASSTCQPESELLFIKFRDAAAEKGLPMAKIMDARLKSGCLGLKESACGKKAKCDWEDGACEASDAVIADVIAKDDSKTAKEYEKVRIKCEKASSESSCKKQ